MAIADEWITGNAARKRLNRSYGALQRLAVLGKIRTLLEPGLPVRYRREDVEAIASAGRPDGRARGARVKVPLETSPP